MISTEKFLWEKNATRSYCFKGRKASELYHWVKMNFYVILYLLLFVWTFFSAFLFSIFPFQFALSLTHSHCNFLLSLLYTSREKHIKQCINVVYGKWNGAFCAFAYNHIIHATLFWLLQYKNNNNNMYARLDGR